MPSLPRSIPRAAFLKIEFWLILFPVALPVMVTPLRLFPAITLAAGSGWIVPPIVSPDVRAPMVFSDAPLVPPEPPSMNTPLALPNGLVPSP
jgi:hypothetical protein